MDSKVIEDVKRIAFDTLQDSRINSSMDFDLTECEKMDSVNRVAILVAIENEYDFIFKLKEISAWKTVGELSARKSARSPAVCASASALCRLCCPTRRF